jgi:hypothetical protein
MIFEPALGQRMLEPRCCSPVKELIVRTRQAIRSQAIPSDTKRYVPLSKLEKLARLRCR